MSNADCTGRQCKYGMYRVTASGTSRERAFFIVSNGVKENNQLSLFCKVIFQDTL